MLVISDPIPAKFGDVETLLAIIALWFVVSLVLAGLLAYGLTRRDRASRDIFRGH
jgi:hypothetical protein